MSTSQPPQLTLFLTKWTKSRYRTQSRLAMSALTGLADVPKCSAIQPPVLRSRCFFTTLFPTTRRRLTFFCYSNHFDSYFSEMTRAMRHELLNELILPVRESTWAVGRLKKLGINPTGFWSLPPMGGLWYSTGFRFCRETFRFFDYAIGDGAARPMTSSCHSISGI